MVEDRSDEAFKRPQQPPAAAANDNDRAGLGAITAQQAALIAREPDEAMRRAFIEWLQPFDPDEIPY